jgi:hypothetical protein
MQKPLFAVAILSLAVALSGCKPKIAEQAESGAPAQSAAPAETVSESSPAKLPRFATPARIAEIKSSGKTGFWADPADFCPGRRVATLTWNVEASGAGKVVVYVVGKDGKEHHFGRGGPVGERQTGPWIAPGIVFVLRNAEGGAELGRIIIPRGKTC